MNKLFNTSLILLLSFVMTAGMLTACDKDDDDGNSGKVELLSFGPSGVRHGDTISFIGKNLTQVTTIQLTGATVEKTGFIQQTPELITIKVPNATVRGLVTLKTATGDITSKTPLDLEVPVKITSVTAQARPGENITIKGEFLNWVTSVTFGLNKKVETFVSKTLTELVVKVPVDAQTDKLSLSTGGTEPLTIITDNALIVTLPVTTGLSPNPVKHKTNLTITGTDLDLVKQILFTGGDTVTSFVSQSATQLVVNVPSKTQKGKVTLVAASGVKTVSTMDLDLVLPAVATMSPNPIDPGTDLTITGTNLDLVSSITFANAPAVTSFVSKTATQIVVTVPMGVLRGNIILGVINSTRTVQSSNVLEIAGSVPPPTIALPLYNDAVTSNWTSTGGWTGGGWGGTKDYNNTSPVREGSKSIKIDYVGGWGSPMQLGHNAGDSLLINSHTTFKISIFGAPGSGGKKVNVGINGADKYDIIVVEGTWTDYSIPISTLTSGAYIKEIILKEFNGSGGFTIYVDALGLN